MVSQVILLGSFLYSIYVVTDRMIKPIKNDKASAYGGPFTFIVGIR